MAANDLRSFKQTVVAGAAAGNVTVTGIKTTDKIIGVLRLDFTLGEAAPNTRTWVIGDLTSQFTITAANTINNTGGTSSAGGILIVTYISAHARGSTIV